MKKIPLVAAPNQKLAFNADGAYWQLHIYMAINHMCADISKNGAAVINGVRCVSGVPLMPYSYMSAPNFGNFIFDSDADWELFDSTCNLYYLSKAEIEEYKSELLVSYDI